MHKQISGWTVNFCPNSPESPFLEFQTRKPPPSPENEKLEIWDDQSLLRNTPPNEKLQIGDDQSLLQNTPPNEKLQIWDDQSLLQNTPPPQMKNFRFEMTKVYSGIPPSPRLGLESGRSYVETNLYPPWIPLVQLLGDSDRPYGWLVLNLTV